MFNIFYVYVQHILCLCSTYSVSMFNIPVSMFNISVSMFNKFYVYVQHILCLCSTYSVSMFNIFYVYVQQVFQFAEKEAVLSPGLFQSTCSPPRNNITKKRQQQRQLWTMHQKRQDMGLKTGEGINNVYNYRPCDHPGQPCDELCPCMINSTFCEKFCLCRYVVRSMQVCCQVYAGVLLCLCRYAGKSAALRVCTSLYLR